MSSSAFSRFSPARLVPARRDERVLAAITLINTVGSGLYLTTGALFTVRVVGLSPELAGLGLAAAGVLGLFAGPLFGHLSDRYGPKRVLLCTQLLEGVAMTGFVFCRSFVPFMATVVLTLIGEQGSRAARGALVGRLAGERRVEVRAYLRSVSNLGVAFGALCAGLVIRADTHTAYAWAIGVNGLSFFGAAALTWPLADLPALKAPASHSAWAAAADRPFLAVSLLQAVACLQYQVPIIALPLWLAERTKAPLWIISPLFLLNTAMVVALQVRASRNVDTPTRAAVVSRRAGLLFAVSSLAFGLTGAVPVGVAVCLLVAGIVVHTLGELRSAAAQFELSYSLAPDHAIGQYQGVFGMLTGGVVALAPALLTVLCVDGGPAGWATLAAVFLVSGAATVPATAWALRTRAVPGPQPVG